MAKIIYLWALKYLRQRDKQHISANSTYALFACCEMSKCIFKAFAVTERGGCCRTPREKAPQITEF